MYIKYGSDRRRGRGTSTDLSTTYPSRSDFPRISKVTVANYLRSGTERGLRTRAERSRAGSASARRYWIVTQYRTGASSRRAVRARPRPPRSHSTKLPGPGVVSWCFTVFPFERVSRSNCALHPQSFRGAYVTPMCREGSLFPVLRSDQDLPITGIAVQRRKDGCIS